MEFRILEWKQLCITRQAIMRISRGSITRYIYLPQLHESQMEYQPSCPSACRTLLSVVTMFTISRISLDVMSTSSLDSKSKTYRVCDQSNQICKPRGSHFRCSRAKTATSTAMKTSEAVETTSKFKANCTCIPDRLQLMLQFALDQPSFST